MGVEYNARATKAINKIGGEVHPSVKKIMGAEGEGGYTYGSSTEFNASTLRTIAMYKSSEHWTKAKSIQIGNRGGTVSVSVYAAPSGGWMMSYQIRKNDTTVLVEVPQAGSSATTFTQVDVGTVEAGDTIEVWVAWYNLNPTPQNCNWDEFKVLVDGVSVYAELPTQEL